MLHSFSFVVPLYCRDSCPICEIAFPKAVCTDQSKRKFSPFLRESRTTLFSWFDEI
jgi:hypothetical protein